MHCMNFCAKDMHLLNKYANKREEVFDMILNFHLTILKSYSTRNYGSS